jgi:hypothetical protein
LLRLLFRLVSALALIALASCENSSTREIGGGYRLKRTDNPVHFSLMTSHENGALIIDEIGWGNPVILARASESSYWDAIDTAHAQHIRISDKQRRHDSPYQAVTIQKVDAAWAGLADRGRLW